MEFLIGLIIVGVIAYVVMTRKPEWIDLIKSKFKK
tara:strand:+ start:192 stop:296 length:105 start_codon:yes stop_codon:yes gene_type:complete